jgi:hypothetical protein
VRVRLPPGAPRPGPGRGAKPRQVDGVALARCSASIVLFFLMSVRRLWIVVLTLNRVQYFREYGYPT